MTSSTPASITTLSTHVQFPSRRLHEEWDNGDYYAGATEPWTIQAVASLMAGGFKRNVLELGCYQGHASEWLCRVLDLMGHGTFHGVDLGDDAVDITRQRLSDIPFHDLAWMIYQGDAIAFLEQCAPEQYDFVWLDDDHEKHHVAHELELLTNPRKPLVRSGGIVCMHDVVGKFDLGPVCERFHGYILDFPRIHAAGGLGIIQVL